MPYTIIGDIGEYDADVSATVHNKCNILTLNNVVMLCDNVIVTDYMALNPLIKLSSDLFYPESGICLPVCIGENNNITIKPLHINAQGELYLDDSYENATIYLNGVCFNVNSKYYTPEIGNIYNNGTSPLTDSLS